MNLLRIDKSKFTFKSLNSKNGQSGFSMIELLVVSGMLSIVGLAISSVISNSTKSQKRLEQRDQQQGNAGYVRSILQTDSLCRNAFCPEDGGMVGTVATPCLGQQLNKLPPHPNALNAANNPRRLRSIQLYSGGVAAQQTILICDPGQGCNSHTYNALTNVPPVAPPYGTPVPGSPGLYVYGMWVTEITDRGDVAASRFSTANLVIQYSQDPRIISGGKFPDTRISLIFRTGSADTTNGQVQSCTSGAVDSLWTLHSNGQDIFRPVGNVGIGTTNPIYNLDVAGPDASQTHMVTRTYSAAAGDSSNFLGLKTRGTAAARTQPQASDRIATFGGANGINQNAWAGLYIYASENHTAAAQGMRLGFNVQPNLAVGTGTEVMTIANDQNVGIGTSAAGLNPSARLHVMGNAGVNGVRIEDVVNPVLHLRRDAANEWFIVGSSAGADRLDFRPGALGNAARMTLLTGGNVGIGILAPTFPLQVNGVVRSTGTRTDQGLPGAADASTNGFTFAADGDTGIFGPGAGAAAGTIAFLNNGAEAMRILANGNIGIGLVAPTARLHVSGASNLSGNTAITGTLAVSGASLFNSTLGVTGLSTLSGGLTVAGIINHTGGNQVGGGAGTEIINYAAFRTTSDARLKENTIPLERQTDLINRINTYNYNYIKDPLRLVHTGVLAQELQRLYPNLVMLSESGFLNVNYPELVPIVIKGLQESNARISQLEKMNQELLETDIMQNQKISLLVEKIKSLEISLNRLVKSNLAKSGRAD